MLTISIYQAVVIVGIALIVTLKYMLNCNSEIYISAEGTLISVANHLAYKPRTDLQIYKKRDLESIFIEIINPKKSNNYWLHLQTP